MKKHQKWHSFYERMQNLGISEQDADSLRRIELTLHRWSEHECNGEIERNEETGKVYSNSMAYVRGYSETNHKYLIANPNLNPAKSGIINFILFIIFVLPAVYWIKQS